MSFKKDFPIFNTNPTLTYLDSASTSQKPQSVIDAMNTYLNTYNSNIHRGAYHIAESSEQLYHKSKKAYAQFIGAASADDIIYTHNATYGFNMVIQSLCRSKRLQKGDTVLLGIREHHANIIPRQIAAETHNFDIQYIKMNDDYRINLEDFKSKYNNSVKIVSLSAASNVTGTIFNLPAIKNIINDETLFIVDGSQIVGKRKINVSESGYDVFITTAHKMFAMTGIGMIYMKKELRKELTPARGGGGIIEDVTTQGHSYTTTTDKREPGTPNVVGGVSLLAAIDYINTISIEKITEHDQELTNYALKKFEQHKKGIELIGSKAPNRLAVFSFILKKETNHKKVGELCAMDNIAIRCGGHCTHPLRHTIKKDGACRASMHIYNTKEDIDKLFEKLLSL